MRFFRFYTEQTLTVGQTVSLDKSQSSHIARVLRLGVGQTVTLFNGDGHDYPAEITSVDRTVEAEINQKLLNHATSIQQVHLAQALARGDRMDYAIQKAVEMGVTEITPLITEFVQVRFDHKRQEKKLRHWQGVITAALEQCGRADGVKLNPPTQFNHWCDKALDHCLYLHPRTDNRMTDAVKLLQTRPGQGIEIAIGPEGGFSDNEIALVRPEQVVGLGPRILRTETAATAVLAIIQHCLIQDQ